MYQITYTYKVKASDNKPAYGAGGFRTQNCRGLDLVVDNRIAEQEPGRWATISEVNIKITKL